jgi:hypothetical protein
MMLITPDNARAINDMIWEVLRDHPFSGLSG